MARPPETYYVYMQKTFMLVGVFLSHKLARARTGQNQGRALVNSKDAVLVQLETGGQRVDLQPRERAQKRPW